LKLSQLVIKEQPKIDGYQTGNGKRSLNEKFVFVMLTTAQSGDS